MIAPSTRSDHPGRLSEDARIGERLGKYTITRRLGEGGMGVVYLAEHESIGQRVAVKLLHPEFSRRRDMVQRFFHEARAVNIVPHPGLVKSFDYGELADGALYIMMEYLEGVSLRARIKECGGPLPIDEALRLCRQVAGALCAAHDKGIIHRDLKPDNVFIVPDPEAPGGERAKLLDFGIAKIRQEGAEDEELRTKSDVILGTPVYMSPEQCRRANEVDGKADVYSLGVMLFQMVAGRTPFTGQSGAILAAHLMEPPPSLRELAADTPGWLVDLVAETLRKDPAQRPSMAEVESRLEQELSVGHRSVRPHPAQPRQRWVVGAAAAVLGVLGVTAWLLRPAPALRPLERTEVVKTAPPDLAQREAIRPVPAAITQAEKLPPRPSPAQAAEKKFSKRKPALVRQRPPLVPDVPR